jgi:Transposase IS66 family
MKRPPLQGVHPARAALLTLLLQADAYSGFGRLYEHGRQRGPMREAACWAHGRRNFFKLAVEKAPLAIEAVKRIDAILAIEREINGLTAEARLAGRAERSVAHRPVAAVELAEAEHDREGRLVRRKRLVKDVPFTQCEAAGHIEWSPTGPYGASTILPRWLSAKPAPGGRHAQTEAVSTNQTQLMPPQRVRHEQRVAGSDNGVQVNSAPYAADRRDPWPIRDYALS